MQDLSYLEALMGAPVGEEEAHRDVWVVTHAASGEPSTLSLQVIGKARGMADGVGAYVRVLLVGAPNEETAQTLIACGADAVYLAPGQPDAVTLTAFLRERRPEFILFGDVPGCRALASRVAQALGASLVTEAEDLSVDPDTRALLAARPVYGGLALRIIAGCAKPQVAAVRPGAFPVPYADRGRLGTVEWLTESWAPEPVQREPAPEAAGPPALAEARIVVGIGRGMEDAEGVELVRRLAARLQAAVAGDRGALDMGWIAPEQLVGATGKAIAPALYIACGIEGTTEHYLGIEGARAIVAICREADAPLLKQADWGIVGPPKEIVRALLAALA